MPESAEAVKTTVDVAAYFVHLLPTNQIQPSRHQTRKEFSEDSIKALAASIKEEGLLEPIIVRKLLSSPFSIPHPQPLSQTGRGEQAPTGLAGAVPSPYEGEGQGEGKVDGSLYELIAGERRLRACKLLGWGTIPARVISTISEGEAAAKGLVENLQREDLNPIEEAQGFQELNQIDGHWTQEQIAKVTGRTQTYISRSLALLDLPGDIQENMRRRIFSRDHGIELARLKDQNTQESLSKQIIDKDLTAKQTRKMVDEALGKHVPAEAGSQQSPPPTGGEGQGEGANGDPFSQVWTELQKEGGDGWSWKVHYKGKGTWTFEVVLSDLNIELMDNWFNTMSKIMTVEAAKPSNKAPTTDQLFNALYNGDIPVPEEPMTSEQRAWADCLKTAGLINDEELKKMEEFKPRSKEASS